MWLGQRRGISCREATCWPENLLTDTTRLGMGRTMPELDSLIRESITEGNICLACCSGPVRAWSLHARHGACHVLYEQQKCVVLNALISRCPHPILIYDEDPIEDGIPGQWAAADPDGWYVPTDAGDDLCSWLKDGNWLLYQGRGVRAKAALHGLSTFNAASIEKAMVEATIALAVSAFHDNDPWCIAVNERLIDQPPG